ncbi:WD40 repeat domain-containing protein [Planctomycetota bacterium]
MSNSAMKLFVMKLLAIRLPVICLLAFLFAPGQTLLGNEPPPITAICFSPDGKFVIAGSQAGLSVHHWPSLKIEKTIRTSIDHVHDISFRNETLVIAGGRPSESGDLEIRNWPDGSMRSKYSDGTDTFYAVDIHERFAAVASGDHILRILDAHSMSTLHELQGHSRRVLATAFFTRSDQLFAASASADHTIRIWDVEGGRLVRTLDNHTDIVRNLAFRPSQAGLPMLASASVDATVRFWQPTIGRLVRFIKLPSEPLDIAWLYDGKQLAAACVDGKLRIIDADTVTIRQTVSAIDGWAYCVVAHPTQPEVAIAGSGAKIRRFVIE